MQRALKALADPTRLHIVQFLANCRCAEVGEDGAVYEPTAGEVCCHLTGGEKITSTISHHLHELENAGIIGIERRGKHMVCSLRKDSLLKLSQELGDLAKGSQPAAGCCSRPISLGSISQRNKP